MKKLINTVLLVAMIFGFSVTGISALSYNKRSHFEDLTER